VTRPQRHWVAQVRPTLGADLEEVEVDAATDREAREKVHAEAIAVYGGKAKIVGIERRLIGGGDSSGGQR
jgi:hypothetical protein